MDFVASMKERFGEAFRENEPLSKHCNFRIGGPAKYFVETKTTQDIADAVRLAKESSVTFFPLGGGSNTLASDNGYEGLVIKLANRNIKVDGDRVSADAGAISAAVARASAEAGLRGFEWAISLPGTIGGAVRGNAGCFGGEMRDVVETVRVLHNGQILTRTKDEMAFDYRWSALKEPGNHDVVIDVTLRLRKGERAEALSALEKNLAGRKSSQPLGSSSAGCMFTNIPYTTEEQIATVAAKFDIPETMRSKHRLGAGWLLDRLGLKGTRVGDAMVSETHANFLVNAGKATADDVVQLIALLKERVRNETGVQLHEEVQYLGF